MAELSMLSRLSESSRGALDWAQSYAEAGGSRQIELRDLWAGVRRTHGKNSPPVVLLSYFKAPVEKFEARLELDRLAERAPQSGRPVSEGDLSPEAMKTLDLAISMGEQYNQEEGGLVRLRDLFGALLLMPSAPLNDFRKALESAQVSSEQVTKAYQEYLGRPRASLQRFLEERFPRRAGQDADQGSVQFDASQMAPTGEAETIDPVVVPPDDSRSKAAAAQDNGGPPDIDKDLSMQLAVSGFSADTRTKKDLVGIGAEVDAFAYLISAVELNPPLAIGLFGDWGAGKTYFMQSLKERIFKITSDARQSGKPQKDLSVYKYIVQIEFNAWHYVEGELWASLVDNILHNLQTSAGESQSLLQKRQQKLIDEMNEKRRDQSLAKEQKSGLEKKRKAKQGEIEKLKEKQVEALRKLDELKAQDVLEAVELSPQERQEYGQVLEDMGLSGAYRSALDFMQALDQLRGELERGNALSVALRRRGWPWTLAILGVILAGPLASLGISLLGEGVPAVTNAALSFSATLGGLTLLLRAGTNEMAALRQRVEQAQARLEAHRRAEEQRFAEQIAELEADLDVTTQAYQKALAVEQELEEQIQALEAELSQITPRRVLLDFINERVESQDYRKWLGVPALIRRDFKQLSELVEKQNEDFLKKDKGKGGDPDQINRIVLYIDDLDRCPPRRVTEVLQAVHLLLAFPLFVVVVAVDSRWLSQSLQSHYGSLLGPDNGAAQNGFPRATPQDYLEKIFQIPFWVRPLGDQARLRILQGLVAGSLKRGESTQGAEATGDRESEPGDPEPEVETVTPPDFSEIQWSLEEAARQYDPKAETDPNPPGLEILDLELAFMQELRALLGETPRSVKRFVNVYWLMKSIALGQVEDFISSQPFAGFKLVQFLLATLTGLPALAHELFALLLSEQGPEKAGGKVGIQKVELALAPGDDLAACVDVLRNRLNRRRARGESVDAALRELERLKLWLEGYDGGNWLSLPAAELKDWAPVAARFSYRMEE